MSFPSFENKAEFNKYFQGEFAENVARRICGRHKIGFFELKRAEKSEHIVFLADDSFAVKFFAPFRNGFHREKKALEFAQGKTSLKIPEIVASGEYNGFNYLIITQLHGELITRSSWLNFAKKEQVRILEQLARGLKELHSYDADTIDFDWHKFIEHQSNIAVKRQIDCGVNNEWIEKLPKFLETNLPLLPKIFPTVFLHGDIHFGNLRLQNSKGKWKISGLFDFADSLSGFNEFDFVAIGLLMIQGQKNLQREFFKAYGYKDDQLDESFRKRLMLMTILYDCSDLKRYALRLKPEAVYFTLEELERAIWNFAE